VIITRDEVAGLVLTGGESRRMGRDKAALTLGDRSLWQIAVAKLIPFAERILLVGEISTPIDTGPYELIPDNPPGLGPIGGIASGLEQSGCEHHLVLAVDYPLIRRELLHLILEKSHGRQAVCGRSPEFLEPLVGYYHSDCASVIRKMIAQGEIRTHRLYERVPSYILTKAEYDSVDPQRLSQINVNTPGEFERVRAQWMENKQ
jgi:molybdopterin-guanine dinucleotide biosynthesis protein A